MQNFKVYYGEYALSHWLKLILNREIELPPYQRNFVWSEDKVSKLIQSFKDGLFIPPVTIGTYCVGGTKKHYILDGQQRLSAILLAFLKKFPNENFQLEDITIFADDNDDNSNNDDIPEIDVRNWKLSYIQDISIENKNIEFVKSKLFFPFYKDITCEDIDISFLNENYLGFSYIKPILNVNEAEQKRYYSSIFRNINISGVKLTPEESRSSLYWLDSELETFFKPHDFDKITIDNNKIDFARYMSFISEYIKFYKNENYRIQVYKVAKGYGTKLKPYEEYIEKFVYHAVGENTSSSFLKFSEMFPDIDTAKEKTKNIYTIIKDNRGNTEFSSIIDADFYIFGILFWSVFLNKEINTEKLKKAFEAFELNIKNKKEDIKYTKRPSSIGKIRERIYFSILSYEDAFNRD